MEGFYTRAAKVFRKSMSKLYGVPCVVIEWDDYVREVRPQIADAPQTTAAAPVEMEKEEANSQVEMPAQVLTNYKPLCMRN